DLHHLLRILVVAGRRGEGGLVGARVVGRGRGVDGAGPRAVGEGPGSVQLPLDGPVRVLDDAGDHQARADRNGDRAVRVQRDVRTAASGQQRRGDGGCGPDDALHVTTPP